MESKLGQNATGPWRPGLRNYFGPILWALLKVNRAWKLDQGAAENQKLNGQNWLDQFWVKPTDKCYVFGWFWLDHWMGQTKPVLGQI